MPSFDDAVQQCNGAVGGMNAAASTTVHLQASRRSGGRQQVREAWAGTRGLHQASDASLDT
jgi:hypothetical protein